VIDWTGLGTFLIGLAAIGTLVWTVFQQRRLNAQESRLKHLESQPRKKVASTARKAI
jgi:hypothetical protein